MTTKGTTLGATRFMTATTTIEPEMRTADLTATAAGLTETVVEIVPAAMKGTGPPMRIPAPAARPKTVPAQRRSLLKETITLLEDMLSLAVRAASARAPSATTTMAGRKGVFRHADAPAWVAEGRVEEEGVAAVAGIDHQFPVRFPVVGKT